MEGAVEYLSSTNWPWIMGRAEACLIAGMPKRSVLCAIKPASLAQAQDFREHYQRLAKEVGQQARS